MEYKSRECKAVKFDVNEDAMAQIGTLFLHFSNVFGPVIIEMELGQVKNKCALGNRSENFR